MKHISVLILFLFTSLASYSQDETRVRDSIEAVKAMEADAGFTKFLEKENDRFKDEETSPLTKKGRKKFKQLAYYKYNTQFAVVAKLITYDTPEPIDIITTTPRNVNYVKYGELHFTIDGSDYVLHVYQNLDLIEKEGYEDYLFLPFTDLTNKETTYGGGRYLDFRIPKNSYGLTLLDFNLSYNPYCAYNYKYSCPIVPKENHLNVKIEAGVMDYHGH